MRQAAAASKSTPKATWQMALNGRGKLNLHMPKEYHDAARNAAPKAQSFAD